MNCGKVFLFLVTLILWSVNSFGQNCDCPLAANCSACKGGLSSLTFRFDGTQAGTIVISDRDELFNAAVQPGGTITVSGSDAKGKFSGPRLTLTIDGDENATLETGCGGNTFVGTVYGSFTITVGESADGGPLCCLPELIDQDPPVIANCPATITQSVVTGCTMAVTWTAPTATDNCAVASFTSSATPGANFPVGTTSVVYTAVDNYGNTSTCSFDVVITDGVLPVFTGCPTNIIVPASPNCKATATWNAPAASDNCTIVTTSSNYNPGDEFNIGTTTVTYTATDASGNMATCSFTITVQDTSAPVFSNCPTNIIVSAGANCKAIATWTAPVASDNCASATTTSDHNPGDEFNAGITTVTYTSTDASGNVARCSFTVTVQDTSLPVFSNCPSNITVTPLINCRAIVLWIPPTANDNCGAPTITRTHNPGSEFSAGTTTVTYTAKDNAGNIATCSFTVTVTDTSNPVFSSCPANIIVSSTANCKAVAQWTTPTAIDNCGAATITTDHNSGSEFSLGATLVTYTATDAAGNKATCSFTVTVTDTSKPVFSNCPTNVTVSPTANCKAVVNWTAPTATDNCGASTITSDYNPGSEFNVGLTVVTYTATDAAGNQATCSFTVTVKDTAAPVFTNCPANITVSPTANCKSIVSWIVPGASDNCSVVNITGNYNPGNEFSVGVTTVSYTATDAAGNKATCSFTVTVKDTTKPVFTNCPENISVSPTSNCKAIVTWTAPVAADNCSVATTSTHTPGSEFSVGSTTVIYTATDIYGNKATCSFIVTVQDSAAPLFSSCPANITIAATANCKAVVTWTAPVATDNCGVATKSNSHDPGTAFTVGTTTVTYTAIDANGNTAKCEFNVIVTYSQTITVADCPADIEVTADETNLAPVTWQEPVFTLQCGSLYIDKTHEPGSKFKPGLTEVKYTASDRAGNSSVCRFNVNVKPNPAQVEPDIQISKLMTPNGDGFNDFLNITNLENYPDNTVTIVDRWGSVLFEASRYDNQTVVWRGVNKNNVLVPTGTYFYFVQINYGDKRMKREGFIELVQ